MCQIVSECEESEATAEVYNSAIIKTRKVELPLLRLYILSIRILKPAFLGTILQMFHSVSHIYPIFTVQLAVIARYRIFGLLHEFFSQ